MFLNIIYILTLFVCAVEPSPLVDSSPESDSPIVTIRQGQLQGKTLVSRKGKTYSAFLGIPYAKQPERFQVNNPNSDTYILYIYE